LQLTIHHLTISARMIMKRHSLVLTACAVLVSSVSALYGQTPPSASPADTASGGNSGIPKAFRDLDDRALPFLSRWTVCEAQVQKIIQQYFKSVGKEPGADLGKISIYGEPKKNGKYELYQIKCGSAIAVKREIDDMLQGVKDLIAEPVDQEGGEKYCHDFTSVSAVGGKVSTDIEKKVGIGENNFRMPTGGRQYLSLSLFEQFLRIGSTNWWIQNTIGNDNAGYMFWHAGEAKVIARRALIDNYDNNTRRAIPNLLKFHGGIVYRLNDGVTGPRRFSDGILAARRMNMGVEPKIAGGLEGMLPLGEDNKTNVFGVSINAELPISSISETAPIGEPDSFSRIELPNRERLTLTSHPRSDNQAALIDPTQVTPLLRQSAQATLFYTWWLEVEGQENPPDNIFRVDIGVNYTNIQETALVRTTEGQTYFALNGVAPATRGGRGLVNYVPTTFQDWVYARFEYRNETSYPFGFSVQYSNQIIMADAYVPLFGNWMYFELKYARPLRDLRPYELEGYIIPTLVFRILVPR
jgi:hypothetical protein